LILRPALSKIGPLPAQLGELATLGRRQRLNIGLECLEHGDLGVSEHHENLQWLRVAV
jgi:hypothetical protein